MATPSLRSGPRHISVGSTCGIEAVDLHKISYCPTLTSNQIDDRNNVIRSLWCVTVENRSIFTLY